MNDTHRQDASTQQRFDPAGRRSFLWIAGLTAAVFLGAMAVQAWHIHEIRTSAVGDGENVQTYGYDLSNLSVDPNRLVASGLPKDGQPVMVDPDVHSHQAVARANDNEYKRVVVGRDMVIGVVVAGQARAYPVRLLNWHEIVNDRVGSVPIAVTFSPVSRAAVVFDRRVDGQTLTFGYSGLIYNHNLVMYDRQADPNDQSLWSQLKFESIAGPRQGERLRVLPMRLVRWEDWVADHPRSQLLAGERRFSKRYKRSPYDRAFGAGQREFPVAPLPPKGDPADRKSLHRAATIAAWEDDSEWTVVMEPFVQRQRIPDDTPVAYARWFVWYAMHGAPARVLSLDLPEARRELIDRSGQ
ncbi:MAG: DUF3179 domain-containing protein [Alphaproteobacteria bacterium]|nr:DUF3179 domain-containing protein [Alphaproteobacteria bacterium]